MVPGITDYFSVIFLNLAELYGVGNPHRVYVNKIREQKNHLQLEYVRNRSFREDLRIILMAVGVMVRSAARRVREV